jgi:hypothetical protein
MLPLRIQGGMNTLRIEINSNSANVFVNDEKVLDLENLRTSHDKGAIGLFALFNSRFSNFRYTSKEAISQTTTATQNNKESNIISQWNITKVFPFIEDKLSLNSFSKEKFTTLTTERFG